MNKPEAMEQINGDIRTRLEQTEKDYFSLCDCHVKNFSLLHDYIQTVQKDRPIEVRYNLITYLLNLLIYEKKTMETELSKVIRDL